MLHPKQGGGIRRRRTSLPSTSSHEARLGFHEHQQDEQRRLEQKEQLIARRSVPPPLPLIQADRRKTPPLAAKAICADGKCSIHIEHHVIGVSVQDVAADASTATPANVANRNGDTSATPRFPLQAPEQCWDLKRCFTDRSLLQQASWSSKQVCLDSPYMMCFSFSVFHKRGSVKLLRVERHSATTFARALLTWTISFQLSIPTHRRSSFSTMDDLVICAMERTHCCSTATSSLET